MWWRPGLPGQHLDYVDLDLWPLGYLDLDPKPKDIEEKTSGGGDHKVVVCLERIANDISIYEATKQQWQRNMWRLGAWQCKDPN